VFRISGHIMNPVSDEPTIRQRLADNMRRLRKERGWSQEDLAAKVPLHRNQIGKIEQARKDTGIDIVEKLARTFGVRAGELLDIHPRPPEQ
jgi:ribosome-binding protein aMBF1 (putative translation factor)